GLAPDYFVQFPEKEPFIEALEGSTLLQQFAALNCNQLLDSNSTPAPTYSWLEEFAGFCSAQKFEYTTPIMKSVRQLVAVAKADSSSSSVTSEVHDIAKLGQSDQHQQFLRYGDYILTRLKQLAEERRNGASAAYATYVVPKRADILLAAHLLREKH
ncbi:MAG TPA: hypothetical protein VMS71_06210, partial [Candidatus Acidoferrum sp.]|nr:hypothetical protein [Candidatus Acidoferrum sp.]